MTHALKLAHQQNTAGSLLTRLFQSAIHGGRRVRSETQIGHNPASASSLADNLVERTIPHLKQAQVVVREAGEIAELAVAGNAYDGIGIPDCINSGEQAAEIVL